MFGLEIVIGVAVLALVGGLASKRGRRLIFGAGSLAMSNVEANNPNVMLQAAKDEFRQKMANYNNALAQVAGVGERLKAQVKAKSAKKDELESRIQANISAGNTDLAAGLASQLETLETDLNHDQQSLTDTEKAYQSNLSQVKITQDEFTRKIDALKSKMSNADIAEAQASAGAALQGVAFSANDLGDTMKSVEDSLDKRYEAAAGKARLMTDLADDGEIHAKEAEKKALDQQALAKFMAKKGLATPASNNGSVAEKQMGPVAVSSGN